MEVIVHESEASVRQHDLAVKVFEFKHAQYHYDEWMLNKLNSLFGGSAVSCFTTKSFRFRTHPVIGPLSVILFFNDRPPTYMEVSEWLALDRLTK